MIPLRWNQESGRILIYFLEIRWLVTVCSIKTVRPRSSIFGTHASLCVLHTFQSVFPPNGQWPAPIGSWRVCHSLTSDQDKLHKVHSVRTGMGCSSMKECPAFPSSTLLCFKTARILSKMLRVTSLLRLNNRFGQSSVSVVCNSDGANQVGFFNMKECPTWRDVQLGMFRHEGIPIMECSSMKGYTQPAGKWCPVRDVPAWRNVPAWRISQHGTWDVLTSTPAWRDLSRWAGTGLLLFSGCSQNRPFHFVRKDSFYWTWNYKWPNSW